MTVKNNYIIKFFFIISLLFTYTSLYAQVTLEATSSSGSAYSVISSAGFGNENPDCVHGSFGAHVTQAYDSDLGKNVFVFHSHIDDDNDRCSNFDRVRMEIKGGSGSPNAMQHTNGQTAYYRWKFKLASNFVGTSSFCHIFQVKAYGGDAGAPLITITPRASVLQIIHSSGSGSGGQGVVEEVSLSPFKGTWVEAYVKYKSSEGSSGTFEITLKRVSDGATLLSYTSNSIDMWRTDADYNRPKWGVYRKKATELNDEQVRFADFCISESSASQCPSDIGGGGSLPSIGTGTTQAENLNKVLYETNSYEGLTVARATGTSTGYVNGEFSGSSGTYDITVRYFDENDGQSPFAVRVDGSQVDSWTANADDQTTHDRVISGVSISNGDEIRIEGARQSGEHGRIDYIQISSAGGGQQVSIYIEAEDGSLTSPMQVYSDGSASSGEYIEVASGSNSTSSPPSNGHATYNFTLPVSGIYQVEGRLIAASTGEDSFWIRMDSGSWIKWNEIELGTSWHWDEVHDNDNGNQLVDFNLSSGSHTLTVAYRETGTQLDRIRIYNYDLQKTAEDAETEKIAVIPNDFQLNAAYPNPFNPSTQISYQLPENTNVSLVIYDIMGREVTKLVNEFQSAGSYEYTWNANNADGQILPSGTYFARLQAGNSFKTIKLLLLK